MPPSKYSKNRTLIAAGAVSCICAVVATYLYLSTTTASVPSFPRRKKILMASQSPAEVLDFIEAKGDVYHELYVTLLSSAADSEDARASIQESAAHVLCHETIPGLTHITRHISPDVVIILPSMTEAYSVVDIQDWVGQVIVLTTRAKPAPGNARVVNLPDSTSFRDALNVIR